MEFHEAPVQENFRLNMAKPTVKVSCQLQSEILHIPSSTIILETESIYRAKQQFLEAHSTRQSVIIKTDSA